MSAPSSEEFSLHTEAAGPAPDAFGSFRVLHQIGAGTLGPVFRGYDAQRERLVAIKLFKLDLPPERVHQLIAEFEQLIAADLSHPGLALPIATGIHDVSAFLAMDYVAADSFDLALRDDGAAPPARALMIAATLAAALDAAAGASIVHGVIHPRDVLMSDDDVKLTGIGVARALEQVGITPPLRRPYTAPERMANAGWDRRADVFSLASLVFELLWGKRVTGIGHRAVDGLTEIKGGNTFALKRAFARALDEDPENRPPTALDFADALKAAFPGVKVAAPAAVKRRPARRESELRLPLDAAEPLMRPQAEVDLDIADLRLGENQRFDDAEVAPLAVSTDTGPSILEDADNRVDIGRGDMERVPEAPMGPPPGFITQGAESSTVLDRSRSAVWPLAVALVLGLALGFAAGFGFGMRVPASPATAAVPAPAPAPAVPGREFTEGTVPDAPKAAAPAPEIRPTREAAKPPAVPRPDLIGQLLIRSMPPGARVFVDDRDVGRTPAAVRDVAVGAHRVRVTQEGYTTEERRVMITRRMPTQAMELVLKRPAQARARPAATVPQTAAGVAGVLVVDSRPAGASVFLDGKLVGTTPMSMPAVSAGAHTIRLERDGYRRWLSTVRVTGSGQSRVTASLER